MTDMFAQSTEIVKLRIRIVHVILSLVLEMVKKVMLMVLNIVDMWLYHMMIKHYYQQTIHGIKLSKMLSIMVWIGIAQHIRKN